jgi:hypothetical protein
VEPARALADLVEISPQIETAAVLVGEGEVAGSIGVPEARAGILALAVRDLLDRAAEFRSDGSRITQLHASLAEGELFAVADTDGRTIVAVATERPAPGLLFYDLKRCLAALAEPDMKPKPKPRRRRTKEADAEA